jgi:hypothetical protein
MQGVSRGLNILLFPASAGKRLQYRAVGERPWSVKLAWNLLPDTDLIESICEENNRDPTHMIGK